MRVFNVAIVGTGFMGPAHTEGLRRLGMNVAGILGSSNEKSSRAAQELGIPKAYGSYAELLADGEIESVHITSPNRHHYAQASEALRAGKHVHCEKPLAMTSAESGALCDLACVTAGWPQGVNYNMRFYPLNWEAAGGWSAAAPWAGFTRSMAATCRTGYSTRPTTTGAC